jgi:hypothetical protein
MPGTARAITRVTSAAADVIPPFCTVYTYPSNQPNMPVVSTGGKAEKTEIHTISFLITPSLCENPVRLLYNNHVIIAAMRMSPAAQRPLIVAAMGCRPSVLCVSPTLVTKMKYAENGMGEFTLAMPKSFEH